MNIQNRLLDYFNGLEAMHPFGTYRYTVIQFSDGTLEVIVFRFKRTTDVNDYDKSNHNKVRGRRINKSWRGIKTTNDIFGYLKELIGEDL